MFAKLFAVMLLCGIGLASAETESYVDILKQLSKANKNPTKPANENEGAWYFPNNNIDFNQYNRYDAINHYLDSLAEDYPFRVKVKDIGKSYENRTIKSIDISAVNRWNKRAILIHAGIHGCEWITTTTALYVIQELVKNFYSNSLLLKDYNWVIVPLFNPDGYEYSRTNSHLWLRNRNIDGQWRQSDASSNPCREYLKDSKLFPKFETSPFMHGNPISNHSSIFHLTLTTSLPRNFRDIEEVAMAGATAIKSKTGTEYKMGSSDTRLYLATGSSDHYALGVAQIPIFMELPGATFFTSPDKIQPIVSETWIGIKAMAEKLISKF